ncbi:MAG: hypothetical protein KY453_05660, partial [Gemmatimonadetes bacterium]|nr:hypothetical protein [Gemmatimonadota bacterium]
MRAPPAWRTRRGRGGRAPFRRRARALLLTTRSPLGLLAPYRRVLEVPHVPALVVGSLLGRLPYGMSSLALVLFLVAQTGSFAAAGAVAASVVPTRSVLEQQPDPVEVVPVELADQHEREALVGELPGAEE